MRIRSFSPTQEGWSAYVAHLERVDQVQWVLDDGGALRDGMSCLGMGVDKEVVGSITLLAADLHMPATAWAEDADRLVRAPDGVPLRETYVQSFFVEEAWRRRGIGRALQRAALEKTRELGCIQMRSWSSLDKPENYALKLSLGFALLPSTHEAAAGYAVSGVYFVKRVDA